MKIIIKGNIDYSVKTIKSTENKSTENKSIENKLIGNIIESTENRLVGKNI